MSKTSTLLTVPSALCQNSAGAIVADSHPDRNTVLVGAGGSIPIDTASSLKMFYEDTDLVELYPSTADANSDTYTVVTQASRTVRIGNNGAVHTNQNCSGTITFNLPPAKVGMFFSFQVQTGQALRIDPDGSETLSLHTGVMQAAGKYMTNSTAGGCITVCCIKDGEWCTLYAVGTWTVEP